MVPVDFTGVDTPSLAHAEANLAWLWFVVGIAMIPLLLAVIDRNKD